MSLAKELILYEDRRYLVLNKPAGMPTAGDSLEQPGSLQHMVMQAYGRMVWAVHQLDKQTSGVNLFVKRKSRVETLTQALKTGCKEYLVITEPLPADTPDRFEVNEPLMYLRAQRRHGVHPDGKPARSAVRVVARGPRAALLLVRLHTGRTHQIRAHLSHLGIALLGDELYGSEKSAQRAPRQMLHAWRVMAKVEDLSEERFVAPLPKEFEEVMERDVLEDIALHHLLDGL